MRLILMGTGPFAVPTFEALGRSEHDIVRVVTRPVIERGNRPAGDHPVLEWAKRLNLPWISPADVNDAQVCSQLSELAADLLVVCDFGQILKPATLATGRLGGVNLHGSLLPKYRGAAPINWAIWHGDTDTGVTAIHMSPRLDAGPILAMDRTAIEPMDDAVTLEERLSLLGIPVVIQALACLSDWDGTEAIGQPQDQRLASKARRLRKSDGLVDWTRTARQITNQVRALKPWPGTYTHLEARKGPLRVILDQVTPVPADSTAASVKPGQVARCDADRLWMATGQDLLALERVQPAGKRLMSITEFLRGHTL